MLEAKLNAKAEIFTLEKDAKHPGCLVLLHLLKWFCKMPTVLFFIDILAMHADLDMHSVLSLHAVLALHAVIRISNDCVNQIMIYFR